MNVPRSLMYKLIKSLSRILTNLSALVSVSHHLPFLDGEQLINFRMHRCNLGNLAFQIFKRIWMQGPKINLKKN